MAGKRVCISCAAEDALLCDLLTAALDAWEVSYTRLDEPLLADGALPETARDTIRQCDVFLRVCTRATSSSRSMYQELLVFNTAQAEDRQQHRRETRTLVNLVLDTAYVREPFDTVTLFIDTANKTRAFWLNELARPLGVATQARRLSRRSALALGVAGAVTLASGTAAGALYLRNKATADAAAASAQHPPAFGPGDKLAGQAAWTVPVSQSATHTDPNYQPYISLAVANDVLYAFAYDTILALTSQRKTLWSSTAFTRIYSPSQFFPEAPLPFANSDILVFQNEDQQNNTYLNVLDSHHRALLWHASVQVGQLSLPAGPSTVVGQTLYCLYPVNSDWSVCAFDLRSGHIQWSYPIGTGTPHPGIAAAGGRLYIGDPFRCTCLHADTGKQIWQYHLPGTAVATAAVVSGVVYFGALDGFFYALDASSGALRWRVNLSAPISAPALVVSNVIYVGDVNGYLWALDAASGGTYWRTFAGADEKLDAGTQNATILYQPVRYRNLVAVVAGDTLGAVDLVSGIRRWAFQTQPENNSTRGFATGPCLFGGSFVIGDALNHVIAVNP